MKKYAKVIQEETGLCEVGLGTNEAFYQRIGMTEQEVEQGYDGKWYVKGHAPVPPEPTVQERLQELQEQLEALDARSIRALRALSAGAGTEADKNKLEDLESQAAALRARMQELAV